MQQVTQDRVSFMTFLKQKWTIQTGQKSSRTEEGEEFSKDAKLKCLGGSHPTINICQVYHDITKSALLSIFPLKSFYWNSIFTSYLTVYFFNLSLVKYFLNKLRGQTLHQHSAPIWALRTAVICICSSEAGKLLGLKVGLTGNATGHISVDYKDTADDDGHRSVDTCQNSGSNEIEVCACVTTYKDISVKDRRANTLATTPWLLKPPIYKALQFDKHWYTGSTGLGNWPVCITEMSFKPPRNNFTETLFRDRLNKKFQMTALLKADLRVTEGRRCLWHCLPIEAHNVDGHLKCLLEEMYFRTISTSDTLLMVKADLHSNTAAHFLLRGATRLFKTILAGTQHNLQLNSSDT